ncbi:lipase family protein [Umezawaea endophytica]|uniref:Lipase n=1 Tax=Umezawaea endophytica TaxID=1654476 RepID=A0A9X2VVH8_9PSEU|nr:lipase family protein [Umezawaea endophytica]MCS7483147.1 lipase [Umezawaea endophytica]
MSVDRWISTRTAILAVVMAVTSPILTAAVTVPGTSAAAPSPAVVRPDSDPFYAVPPHLDSTPDGTVLRSRRLPTSALATPAPAQVWQLLYKTRDNAGRPTATVATLLVPTAKWAGEGSRPLLSYQTPEDGLATFCAPSYLLRAGSVLSGPSSVQFDRDQVKAAIHRGWAVVVPDYEGPRSEFLGAAAAAHGVLDGIRAARSFTPARVSRKAPVGLWGYSGGGFATAAAAQLQADYAPELAISGIAEGGVIADINASVQAVGGQAFSGWLPFGFAALRHVYPHANVNQYLNSAAQAQADAVQHGCAGEAITRGPFFAPLTQFEAWSNSLTSGSFHDFAHSVSPISFGGTPTAPVYLYHGTADELIPVEGARKLAARYRASGADVTLVQDEAQDHGDEQAHGVAGAVAFLDRQFSEQNHRSSGLPQ